MDARRYLLESASGASDYAARGQALKDEWQHLCARYLPVASENWIWRHSRTLSGQDPEQGWKLHISATILTANEIMRKVAPVLTGLGVLFKAPGTLEELSRLNCGLFYGFSQIGKFITIYPRTSEEAVWLAQKLHRLTCGFAGPAVPYDLPFAPNSRVHYRYGSFQSLQITEADGTQTPAIKKPNGQWVADLREPGAAVPDWITSPFISRPARTHRLAASASPLRTTFRAYEALSQRGKGGVYRALDLSMTPARLCILKEGRRHGETDWDGRDGYWRVKHERQVLACLAASGVEVPRVYDAFEADDNYYLATEFIEGKNLQSLLMEKHKKLPLALALDYGVQVARLMQKIHSAGWIWRDCKPLNLILTARGKLRPLDFEGACRTHEIDKMPWGTPGYVPPEWLAEPASGSRAAEDRFALGATLYHLLSSSLPPVDKPLPALRRRHIPIEVQTLIAALLQVESLARPSARTALSILRKARHQVEGQRSPDSSSRSWVTAAGQSAASKPRTSGRRVADRLTDRHAGK